jgi:hypothetical protein
MIKPIGIGLIIIIHKYIHTHYDYINSRSL